MAFIDSTYLGDSIGATHRDTLCPHADRLARLTAQAESLVEAALVGGGYTRRASSSVVATTPEVVKLACVGQFLLLAYGQHYGELPPTYNNAINIIEHIRTGMVEIDGESRNSRMVQAVVTSDVTSTVANGGNPRAFTRKKLSSW